MRYLPILLLLPLLAACGGGGNTPAPVYNAPRDNSQANTQAGDDGDADGKSDDGGPKEDPDKFKKVSGKLPEGWRAMSGKDARGVLERHFKPLADAQFINGILNSKPPGATEGEKEWDEWEDKAAGAILYYLPGVKLSGKAAVEKHAKELAAGEPDIKVGGDIASTLMQGGEIMVFGISNANGTYIAVGVVLTPEAEPAREAIRKWAESIKPE